MVTGTVAASLVWLVRRPGNRLGYVLLALAVATAIMSLQGATQPLLHSLGIAVVGGLAFSQVVTLFVTPVFYTYLDDLQSWLGKVSSKLPWSSDHETPPADRPTLAAGD